MLILSLTEIAIIYNCSVRTAQNIKKEVQEYFSLSRKHRLTTEHIAMYENIPHSLIIDKIKPPKTAKTGK